MPPLPRNPARRRRLLAGAALLWPLPALGQGATGPARPAAPLPPPSLALPLRLILPTPAGTRQDRLAAALAQALAPHLAGGAVVENRSGSEGAAAIEAVAYGPADGAALLLATASLVSDRHQGGASPVDPLRELAPVALLAEEPLILAVAESSGSRTLADLVALARGLPGKVRLGSAEPLATLISQQFAKLCGIAVAEARFPGTVPMREELADGALTAAWLRPSAIPAQAAGLRLLGCSTAGRSPQHPEVPAIGELGEGRFDLGDWSGLLGAGGLAAGMVEGLYGAIGKAFVDKRLPEAIVALGMTPKLAAGGALQARMRADNQLWSLAPRQPPLPRPGTGRPKPDAI